MLLRASTLLLGLALTTGGALVAGCATTDSVLPGWQEEGDGGSTGTASGEGGGFVSNAECGDGVCQNPETPETCAEDCLDDPCGDDLCDAGETCSSCEADCGSCAPACGDGVCDASEDCGSCEADCGVCVCEVDAFEPNQGSGTATPASSGVDYCGLSICAGDVDWFRFNVTGPMTARIEFLHAEGDLDLEIYGPSYVSGSYSKTDDEAVTLNNLTPGTYYARVYGYGHTAQGGGQENWDYCFRVDL